MFVSNMCCCSYCLNFDVQLMPPRRYDKVVEFLREAGEITEVKSNIWLLFYIQSLRFILFSLFSGDQLYSVGPAESLSPKPFLA